VTIKRKVFILFHNSQISVIDISTMQALTAIIAIANHTPNAAVLFPQETAFLIPSSQGFQGIETTVIDTPQNTKADPKVASSQTYRRAGQAKGSSTSHSPSFRNQLKGEISNLRGHGLKHLGYHALSDPSDVAIVAGELGVRKAKHIEIFNVTAVDRDNKFALDPTQFGIAFYNKNGVPTKLISIPKEARHDPLQAVLHRHLVTFPGDYSGKHPEFEDVTRMNEKGQFQLTGRNTDIGEDFGMFYGGNMFVIPKDQLWHFPAVSYVGVGTKRGEGQYVSFGGFGPWIGRGNEFPDLQRERTIRLRHTDMRKAANEQAAEEGILDPNKHPRQYARQVLHRNLDGWTNADPEDRGNIVNDMCYPTPPTNSDRQKPRSIPSHARRHVLRRGLERVIAQKRRKTLRTVRHLGNDARVDALKMSKAEALAQQDDKEGIRRKVRTKIVPHITQQDLFEIARTQSNTRTMLYTQSVLDWVSKYRPSVGRAIALSKGASESDLVYNHQEFWAQIKTDLSRVILTVDNSVIHSFTTEGTVRSKYRALQRVFSMTNNDAFSKRTARVMQRQGQTLDDTMIGLKSIAIDYLMSNPGFSGVGGEMWTDTSKEICWMGDMMDSMLGDTPDGLQLVDLLSYGSYTRFIRGEVKKYGDHDFMAITQDYKRAIQKLQGTKLEYQGKPVQIVVVPQYAFRRLMAVKPESIVQASEGLMLHGKMPIAIPNARGMEMGPLSHIAARHNTLQGMVGNLYDFAPTLVAAPGLTESLAKIPMLNMEAAMLSQKKMYVDRPTVESAYKGFLEHLGVEDPRKILPTTPDEAKRAIVTATYVSGRIIEDFMVRKQVIHV
jgi:hypothetical protein